MASNALANLTGAANSGNPGTYAAYSNVNPYNQGMSAAQQGAALASTNYTGGAPIGGTFSVVPGASYSSYPTSSPVPQQSGGGILGLNSSTSQAQASFFGPGASATGSAFPKFGASTAYTQSQQQKALAQQQAQAQMDLLNAAVSQAKSGQSFLAPSPEAYKAAADAYTQYINQGLSAANSTYGTAIGASNTNMQSAIDALNNNYGLAIGTVQDYGGQAVGRIDAGTSAAQQYLADAYSKGASALNPYTSDAANTYSNLANFVNGGFAGDFAEFTNSPVYQLGMNEGQKALQNSAAARGALQSGQTLKDLTQYANDYAAQQYFNYTNQRYQQLADLANMGYTGSATLANLANQTGQAQSGVAMQGALGAADILNQTGQASGQLYGDLGTRLGVTYEDFTGMNNQLYAQQAQAALAASQANAQAQKEGILGAGQQMYNTNYYNKQAGIL